MQTDVSAHGFLDRVHNQRAVSSNLHDAEGQILDAGGQAKNTQLKLESGNIFASRFFKLNLSNF